MSLRNPMDRGLGGPLSYLQDDLPAQSGVVSILLAEYPAQLTPSGLADELIVDPGDFTERDAVRQAVSCPIGVGLFRRQVIFVLPSHTAPRFGRHEVAGVNSQESSGGQS